MFRRARILRAAMPIEETPWIAEDKRFFAYLCILAGTTGLYSYLTKKSWDRKFDERIADLEQGRAELSAYINSVISEMKAVMLEIDTWTAQPPNTPPRPI